MGYELTIYVDNYPALEYDHPTIEQIINTYKEKIQKPAETKTFTKEEMIGLREYCYQQYTKEDQEEDFDYEYEGERYLDLIRDLTILFHTFPSIPKYTIHHN